MVVVEPGSAPLEAVFSSLSYPAPQSHHVFQRHFHIYIYIYMYMAALVWSLFRFTQFLSEFLNWAVLLWRLFCFS